MTGKKILIIDDEPDIITYYKAILEDDGHTIFTANNAEEGMNKLKESRPDLILLDLLMPHKTGIKLFSELKKVDGPYSNIPVILATGIKDEKGGDHKKFFEGLRARKPDAYLEKPVEPADLLKTVNEVLGSQS
jgi:CheY-like chemotaxis protein